MVDWDLEAPGLHHYFTDYQKSEPITNGGTVGLLEAMASDGSPDSTPFEVSVNIPKTEFFPGCKVELLEAGMGSEKYERRVLDFNLKRFYVEKQGAAKLEALRETWRERFDFVLIDSRTGITDTGGICTIFFPDVLAVIFTPNEQSLRGAIQVAHRAQKGRQKLSFDRRGLLIIPIPSRYDFRTETDEADRWMKRFSEDLAPFFSTWCPREISPRSLLERIRVPQVPFFSFGEKLPTVTHGVTNTDRPGFYYENIVRLLEEEFSEHAILWACGLGREFRRDISRIAKYAPAELIGREDELKILDDVWSRVTRGDSRRPHVLTFVALGGEGKTSLVAKWVAELAHRDWPGCDAAFAWSFYSQGTGQEMAPSSDLFLKEAITFFGEEADRRFAASSASAFEKGQRLARLVSESRNLLILDGLEPLQYAPMSPTAGELKDSGIAALLRGLAGDNHGLCIVTTRYSIKDLKTFWQTTAPEVMLLRLSREAGVHLLKTLGVKGVKKELESLVEDVSGHALTLNLLGTYLRDAHGGDIRRRDLVNLEEADTESGGGGQAFRLMDQYVSWFESEGEKGKNALAVLSLLGLFNRPATAELLVALMELPAIPNLTEPLIKMSDAQRNIVLKRLEDARLLTIIRDSSGALISLDTHPLVREYFSYQLRMSRSETWRAAHQRLFEYLCHSTPDKDEPVLEDLQPLYQAVAHGCQAGMLQKAYDVYHTRINRGQQFYSTRKLGAFASSLGAVGCFFDTPWNRLSLGLSEQSQALLLAVAAFSLCALGRLTEALEPMRAGLTMYVKQQNWRAAAKAASNLSELEVTLGHLAEAIRDAEQSVRYADHSGNAYLKMATLANCADVLNQMGHFTEAQNRFIQAEKIQGEREPEYPQLFSLRGFQYCDFLLSTSECRAWQRTLANDSGLNKFQGDNKAGSEVLDAVLARAAYDLQWVERAEGSLIEIPLDHLTWGRASLYGSLLSASDLLAHPQNSILTKTLDNVIKDLRLAGQKQYLPPGLLTRAWVRLLNGGLVGSQSAAEDLNEAWEIAERGPMRLHMADIHLYRARLFFREKEYPWESAEADLKAARKLIEQCGYWRRKEELEDAERVILKKSV